MTTKTKTSKHIITLTVKNGPFKTRDAATQTRSILAQQGVKVGAVVKASSGYMFTSKLGYIVPTIALREKVVGKLRAHASASGVRKSAVSITTRTA